MFHMKTPGVTTLTDWERGVLLGILMSDGSFGGDGRQPHCIVKAHVRREGLLRWLVERVPGAKLYGPYFHGDRHYLQVMVRGQALQDLLASLDLKSWQAVDPSSFARVQDMMDRYRMDLDSG